MIFLEFESPIFSKMTKFPNARTAKLNSASIRTINHLKIKEATDPDSSKSRGTKKPFAELSNMNKNQNTQYTSTALTIARIEISNALVI